MGIPPSYIAGPTVQAITYLDSTRVTATRQTEPPRNRSRTGYGSKLPSSWMLQLDNKRWHRVYIVCWSNAGSAYVVESGARLFLGSYDPGDSPPVVPARKLALRDRIRGKVWLNLRDDVVVGATGSEPERFIGLTESQARHVARYGGTGKRA